MSGHGRDEYGYPTNARHALLAENKRRGLKAPKKPKPTPPEGLGSHAGRYPVHDDPEKGQVYGGICNVTRCDYDRAVYWNIGTYGLYCPACATGINFNPKIKLCVRVEKKPALADMEKMRKDHGYYEKDLL